MSAYCMNEAVFELPALGFVDRTMTVLDATSDDGFAHTILVQRGPWPEGKSLAEVVAGNLRDGRIRLQGHDVVFTREITVDGAAAIELGVQWRGARGIVYARQVCFAAKGAFVVIAGSTSIDDRARCDGVMDRVVTSFRFRA